jgi:hypothetical protein
MNVDELNAKYDEIYSKTLEIHQLLAEVEDTNDILFYLYKTKIKRPNSVLNTMIDNYEALILKLRETDKEIKASLAEFGDETELAEGVKANDRLSEKIKELVLWKLRRLFMIYDDENIQLYVNSEFLTEELTAELKAVPAPKPESEENSAEAGVFSEADPDVNHKN